MPGVPLLNLGTALGGLVNGYQNYQQNNLANLVRQLQLQTAQRQAAGQSLAGQALAAGLLGQQETPTSPLQMLPGQGAGTPPPSPSGGGAQPGYAPPLPGAPPMPNGGAATAWSPQQGQQVGSTPPIFQQALPPPPSTIAGPDTGLPPGGQAAPGSGGDSDASIIPGTQTYAAPATQDEKTPAAPASGDGGDRGSVGQPPAGQSAAAGDNTAHTQYVSLPGGQTLSVPDLFQTMDPGKLAQRIATIAPPGTDPATILEATQDLVKLSNGNKEQQIQAGYLAKLLGAQVSLSNTATRTASQERIAAGREQSQQTIAAGHDAAAMARTQATNQARADLEAFKQGKLDARAADRIQQGTYKLALQAQQAGQAALAKQLSAINTQIRAIQAQMAGNNPDDAQAARLKQLGAAADALGAQMAAQGQQQSQQ